MSREAKGLRARAAGLSTLLLVAGILSACAGPAPPPGFDLQGHRGGRGLFPDNTQAAFAGALALGVNTLEMDTVVTRDGVVVVHHGRRLDAARTRGADGAWIANPEPYVAAITFAELQKYDVGRARPGGKTAERFPGQVPQDGARIPRLAEVLTLAEARSSGAMRYNIETKRSPLAPAESPDPEKFAAALVAELARFDLHLSGRAMVQSFDWTVLAAVHLLAPALPTACLTAEQPWLDTVQRGQPDASPWTAGRDVDAFAGSVPHMVRAAGCAVWSPYFKDLDAAAVADAQALGLRVVVWTVNDPADMERLIVLGVDGIITDYPDRLRAVMRARGMVLPPAFPAAG